MKYIQVCFVAYIIMVGAIMTKAQSSSCSDLVRDALTLVTDACLELGQNNACYGHNSVKGYDHDNHALSDFTTPGDIVNFQKFQTIETSALNIDTNQWGIALLSLQANMPDTVPGQNVVFVVYGDTHFTRNIDTDTKLAFQFKSGIGIPQCEEVPQDGILVQTTKNAVVNFTLNGVEIEIGSTALLNLTDTNTLRISTLEGLVTAHVEEESQQIEAGYTVGATEEMLSEPELFDYETIRHVPLALLPESIAIPVNVPANIDWFDSDIMLTQGETFTLTASGVVNPCTDCEGHPSVGPEGFLERGTPNQLGMPDDLMPPLPDEIVASLIGRIGTHGEPFYIGAGGQFNAASDGTLQFRINDEPVGNESGSWLVIVDRSDG